MAAVLSTSMPARWPSTADARPHAAALLLGNSRRAWPHLWLQPSCISGTVADMGHHRSLQAAAHSRCHATFALQACCGAAALLQPCPLQLGTSMCCWAQQPRHQECPLWTHLPRPLRCTSSHRPHLAALLLKLPQPTQSARFWGQPAHPPASPVWR